MTTANHVPSTGPKLMSLLSLPDAFVEGGILRDNLPKRPRVCWSVSAGHDMRPLVFFSDPMRRATIRSVGLTPEEFPRPDLFLFTCIDGGGQGLHDLELGQIVYEDESTRIVIDERHPLRIDRNRVPYSIDRSRVYFGEDPLKDHDHDAALLRVRLTCLQTGYEEQVLVLYLAMENLLAWDSLMCRADVELDTLVATREGLGLGGCGRSILEHLYQDGRIQSATTPRSTPRYVVTWGDYTDQMFCQHASRFYPNLRKGAPYIPERGSSTPHQIYILNSGDDRRADWAPIRTQPCIDKKLL